MVCNILCIKLFSYYNYLNNSINVFQISYKTPFLKSNDLDSFVGLTRNPAWRIDYEGGDDAAMANQVSYGNGAYAAIAGYPHLTIPLASINNLPVGVSLIGPAWSDAMLLQMGYELEKNKESF